MKRFSNLTTLLVATFCITMALPGCGSNNSNTPTPTGAGAYVAPIIPGGIYNGGTVVPTPGGGAQVNFTGISVYNDNIYLDGGMSGSGANCSLGNCYCGLFPVPPQVQSGRYYVGPQGQGYPTCIQFTNLNHSQQYNPNSSGTGQVTIGAYGLPAAVTGSNMYVGTSGVEPGATVTVVSSAAAGGELNHSNISGSITLPPRFVQANWGGAIPAFTGLGFSFYVRPPTSANNYTITGGVLLFTSGQGQPGSYGSFLAI